MVGGGTEFVDHGETLETFCKLKTNHVSLDLFYIDDLNEFNKKIYSRMYLIKKMYSHSVDG